MKNNLKYNEKVLRFVLLILTMLLVLFWQSQFAANSAKLDSSYVRSGVSGLSPGSAKQFLYFYYYLNLFPIVSYVAPTDFSKQGAENFLENHSQSIHMDYDYAVYWGDNVKNLMYFPDAILKGSAKDPSVKTYNSMTFLIALLLLLLSFYYVRRFSLGVILVLLIGSNPFQLYEVYTNENFFCSQITTAIFLLAINLPLFFSFKKPKYYEVFAVGVSAIILGTMAHIRAEALVFIISCLMVYFFIPKIKFSKKFIYVLLFLLVFFVTEKSWVKYFDYKYDQAKKVVQSVGGHLFPYANLRSSHHTFWHSVFIGFSDFDKKYGYKWSDTYACNYAEPILIERGVSLPKEREIWSVMPEYQQVIKEKIISQIRDDTKWYLDILYKRLNFIFEKTIPISIGFGNHFLSFAFRKIYLFVLVILLSIFLAAYKQYFLLKLFLFSIPSSFIALFVYSLGGATNMSIFHIFAFAICIYLILLIFQSLIMAKRKNCNFVSVLKELFGKRDDN